MDLLPQNTSTNLMTAEQIAGSVGISRIGVLKNKKLDDYFAGLFPNPKGTGRPVKMYRSEALTLWGKSTEQISETARKLERKGRDDRGGLRKSKSGETWCTAEQLTKALQLTKELYINNAQRNLRLACEQASKMMQAEPGFAHITSQRLYRRLQRNGKNGDFRSEYFTEGWESIRMKKFKVKDHVMNAAGSLRYNYWQIMENAGAAGKGHGACNVIIIDDFKRDAWTAKDGKLEMPVGIAYIDGLTGYPLLLLPAPSITTEAVAAGMLMVAYAYGLPEQAIWVMENSKAMKNINIEMLARTMYTKEELYDFDNGKVEWVKDVFYGQTGPVVRSLPHIPKHPFKARIERFFKIVKDEFDATRFPLNYQGGDRKESTQLSLASIPMVVGQETKELPSSFYTVTPEKYWEELYKWLYSDCIMRSRPAMLQEWAKEKSEIYQQRFSPTINECFMYYRNPDFKREVDVNRLAYLLYWAQSDRHLPKNLWKVKKTLYIEPTINGNHLNLFCEAIDHTMIGRRLATIPIPKNPSKFFIFIADDATRPELLGIATDATMRDSKMVPIMRRRTQVARDGINEKLDNGAKRLAVWDNQHETGELPIAPPEWTKELHPNGQLIIDNGECEETADNDIQTVDISDDMAELLGDADDLLNLI